MYEDTCSGCQKRWDLMLAMQTRAQEAKILRLYDHEGYFLSKKDVGAKYVVPKSVSAVLLDVAM